MLLSSCVIWRHRSWAEFRADCPDGEIALQRRLVEELDGALDWLESLGAEPVASETGNPLTVGRRYDPRGLTGRARGRGGRRAAAAAVRGGGGARDRRVRRPARAGRGACSYARPVERRRRARVRARARRRSLTGGHGASSTAARCPAPCRRDEFVRAAQLYARHALVLDDDGRDLGEPAWHESDIVQRFPDGKAWYVVDARALREPVRERTVAELVEAARGAGGEVRPAEELPFELPPSPKLVEPPFLAVRVYAAVTHTIGGLRIDERARVLDAGRDADAGSLCGGRRRGRDLHRRLRQRSRRGARLRPRSRPRLPLDGLRELRVRAGAAVARERRGADLADPEQRVVRLDRRADGGNLAVALLQRPAAGRPDEEQVPAGWRGGRSSIGGDSRRCAGRPA